MQVETGQLQSPSRAPLCDTFEFLDVNSASEERSEMGHEIWSQFVLVGTQRCFQSVAEEIYSHCKINFPIQLVQVDINRNEENHDTNRPCESR